jgi:TatA/E family protein of Tat protein translocase
MGNIGSSELLIILVLALLLLGPKRLPDVGDALGKTIRRFRQASRELRDEIDVDRPTHTASASTARRDSEVQPAETPAPAPPSAAAPAATLAPPPAPEDASPEKN